MVASGCFSPPDLGFWISFLAVPFDFVSLARGYFWELHDFLDPDPVLGIVPVESFYPSLDREINGSEVSRDNTTNLL